MQYLLTLHVSDHVSCIMHVRKKLYIYTMANIAFQLENIKLVGRTVRKMSILISQLEGPSSQELIYLYM